MPLDGDEIVNEIAIKWNKDYEGQKDAIESHQGTKDEVLDGIRSVRDELTYYAEQAIAWFTEFKSGRLSEDELIRQLQGVEKSVNDAYTRSGNLPMPPEDCADFDEACQVLFGSCQDMFVYYSEKGLNTWDAHNRQVLMMNTIRRYRNDLEKVKFEESKIH